MPFYAVAKGKNPGVYLTWAECQANVNGFSGAKFKKFPDRLAASDFVKKFGSGTSTEDSVKEERVDKENDILGTSQRKNGPSKRKGDAKPNFNQFKKSKNDDKKSDYPEGKSDKDADYEPYNTLKETEDGYLLKKDGETYVVYTDGACPGNQNKKGLRFSGSGVWWGPAKADSIPNDRFENEYSTNNFGEARAILAAVK